MVDQYDNINATREFWQAATNRVVSTCISVYANVIYTEKDTGIILYRSPEPVQVMIDTTRENNVSIPELAYNEKCFSQFWTRFQRFSYSNGVLTIEGDGYGNKKAYRATIL